MKDWPRKPQRSYKESGLQLTQYRNEVWEKDRELVQETFKIGRVIKSFAERQPADNSPVTFNIERVDEEKKSGENYSSIFYWGAYMDMLILAKLIKDEDFYKEIRELMLRDGLNAYRGAALFTASIEKQFEKVEKVIDAIITKEMGKDWETWPAKTNVRKYVGGDKDDGITEIMPVGR